MSMVPNPLMSVLAAAPENWQARAGQAALLVIDMQYYDAHPDFGVCRELAANGLQAEYRYYTERLADVVPRIGRLLTAYRAAQRPVFYAVIESLLPDGADRCLRHKRVGLHVPPGSPEGRILEELAPRTGEHVFKKTTASVFNSTNIDRVLRNAGIETLAVCGVVTNGCVESTVRDAADLSYDVIMAEDACAALTDELHVGALRTLQHSYCTPVLTEKLIAAVAGE